MLLRRAAVFAVLMLAAQTALWAYKVTLKPGRGTGEVIVLDSEEPTLQATDNDHFAEGKFFMDGEKLWFMFPFCPGSFTAPTGEVFLGWYINAEDGKVEKDGHCHILTEDLVLIAKWGAVEFEYYGDGGIIKFAATNNSPREVKLIEILNMEGDNLTIPASVEDGDESYSVVEIADGLGAYNEKLTALTIPATVRRIGTEAFRLCNHLTTVTFEEGSQLTSAGENAFNGCQSLQYIYNIPCSVKSDEGEMFFNNSGLEEVTIWGNNGKVNTALRDIYGASTVKMTVPANKFGDDYWTTFFHGEASFQADASTTVYKAELIGSSLQLHEVADRIVNRATAVILKSTGNPVLTKTDTESSDEAPNDLQGSSSELKTTAGAYVFSGGAEGLGFYPFSGTQLNDGEAHIIIGPEMGVYDFVDMMETPNVGTTAIPSMPAQEAAQDEAAPWYSIDGRRLHVRPTRPGIYLRGGRKVIIK